MSSYPGSLSSIDDWYMTSYGLAATETTNSFNNDALNAYVLPQSVSEFMRAMVANFVSTTAPEWVQNFASYLS